MPANGKSIKRPHGFKDIAGSRFGALVAIECNGHGKHKEIVWKCKCDCGNIRIVSGTALRLGRASSCGCLTRAHKMRHGHRNTITYASWIAMKARCNRPSHMHYSSYGGRGIVICERWLQFENFLADMGPRPSRKHSLDRIDNDGNYEPGNCRWATAYEQGANTRQNRLITFRGTTMCLKNWARTVGIKENLLRYRISKGWTLDKALTTPTRRWIRKASR
jgi:hypothetical protein